MNELRTCHLFAGIGGGLLADLILGHRPIVAVEWEPYACKVLRERAAEGWFPDLHVWEGDVRLFDPSEYAGKVDCIHAGFPCQDISVAGKQAGVSEGTRSGLYREVLRIAGIVRPRYLFLENVAAILSNGLGTVLADLAEMGYDSRWICLRASDVGAPHHRDRWFLLADDSGRRLCESREREIQFTRGAKVVCASEVLADSDSNNGGTGGMGQDSGTDGRNDYGGIREVVSDAERIGLQRQGKPFNAINKAQAGNRETTESIDGGFRGFWSVEPGLGRVANGVPNRVGQLKGYGNAQVPLQAATAWRLLGGV